MKDDYRIELGADRATLSGVMRLHSPEAYEEVLAEVKGALEAPASTPFVIDVVEVAFMNSSGIRGLAGLVLAARAAGRALIIVGRAATPWQKKTLTTLRALDPRLEVQLG